MTNAAEVRIDAIPTAVVVQRRNSLWIWLIPLAAFGLALWLAYQAWAMRGVSITVQLDNGHGLKAGDFVRYRGINVGVIDEISLAPDLQSVLISARLTSQSGKLARTGSRFWVVRPQLALTSVQGLETIIGPRFLAALPPNDPHNARWQRYFIGLNAPPQVESWNAGDLEVILQAAQRGSLHEGAPISYRQTRIGTILSVGLAADGSAVEARAHIQQPFVQLIRPNTHFWDVGGLQAKLGLTGLSIEIDSAEALLAGGVALATPPPDQAGGEVVRTGHRFTLVEKPEKEWLQWQPMVAIGMSMLPPGALPPSPLRASIGWKQGRWITRAKSKQGWVLHTGKGLLGPADVLKPPDEADRQSVVLEVNGRSLPMQAPVWEARGLALFDAKLDVPAWPAQNFKADAQPEDCLLIADASANPLPLAASRLHADSVSHWRIDQAVSLDESWHGACVVSRNSGAIIGVVLIGEDRAVVAVLPPELAN